MSRYVITLRARSGWTSAEVDLDVGEHELIERIAAALNDQAGMDGAEMDIDLLAPEDVPSADVPRNGEVPF